MNWEPIETAPIDRIILVNDTTSETPWAAARWVSSDVWSGWIYDDDEMADSNPLGPEPTHWLDVPPVPED